MISNQFDKVANALEDEAGRFWFSGLKGITRFLPSRADRIKANKHIPPVILTSFNSKAFSEKSLASKALKKVKLKWRDNSFDFTFATLDYTIPQKNQFAFKLVGLDEDWHYIGNNHFGQYVNLPPGEYTLLLKGANSIGTWNNAPTSLSITVAPALWQTWWFRVGSILFALFLVLAFIKHRTKTIRRKAKVLEEHNKELTKHIEERKRAEKDARKAREEKYEAELNSERDHAIASTTSIVAHDVRKPFTQLKAMLGMLPHLKEEEISTYSGELDLSLRKVDAMLSDIMEYSRDAEYTVIPENILVVLDLSIKDTSRYNPKEKVEFHYSLETLNLINLDEQRLSRAFDNIIGNAFEAMPNENAFIWFITKGYKNHAEIIIGNAGSHIPEDQIGKIFDNKFTSGKKSGTGLGLGIVKKVIEGHNGSVTARNVEHAPDFVPDNIKNIQGVEFVVTLPITKIGGYELKDPVLNNSQEAKIKYGMVDKKNRFAGSSEIDTLIKKLESLKMSPRLLILDDESIYRMRVKNVWDKLPEVKAHTMLFDASSYKEAIEILDHTKIDYLICDIDLTDKKKSGFDVLKFTKEKYPDCRVIMHTNRREPEDIKEAEKLGACGFCPKPITEAIFVDLLSDKDLWPGKTEKVKKTDKADKTEVEQEPGTKKNILFLNDDKMLNFSVKISLKSSKYFVETFTNVDDALAYYRKNKVYAIFSDIDLKNMLNGYDFLKEIRAKDKDIPFIFVSGSLRDTEWPKAKKLGATEYFQLPIEEELEKVIDSFVKE